jgi:uncharacterized SAM-binding protein YcdF (DUF218 family)
LSDPKRVAIDERSRDTCDSPKHVLAQVKPRPQDAWILVTTAAHLPRAVACFRHAGWKVIPHPADYFVASNAWGTGAYRVATNLTILDFALHEWVGLVYYRLTGRTSELFPADVAHPGNLAPQ